MKNLIADPVAHMKFDNHRICKKCFRPSTDCMCATITTQKTRLKVVILQHPQEQLKILNSARLAHLALAGSSIRIGLSWPSFKAATGPDQIPSEWGVLFLGSASEKFESPVVVIDRKRQNVSDYSFLKGIIALDGNWKQAKTLWWRNPWLLRVNRISLNANHPSIRKQAKKTGLSTIEAIAFALENLGEIPAISVSLREQYATLIVKPAYEAGAAGTT